MQIQRKDVIRVTLICVIGVTTNLVGGIPPAQLIGMETRRRSPRITLPQPVRARACGELAYVVDASVGGVRLWHSAQFAEGKPCPVSFDWQGKPIEFIAELRWTKAQRGEDIYQSGFEIQSIDPSSNAALRSLIEAWTVVYDRHELVHGVWRKTTTTDPRQPESGFTVLPTESIHEVDLMRAAYSVADPAGREIIRRLAALSIIHPERRYKG